MSDTFLKKSGNSSPDPKIYCTSSVTEMSWMFSNAEAFDQDLSSWDVSNVTYHNNFDGGAISWTLQRPQWNP